MIDTNDIYIITIIMYNLVFCVVCMNFSILREKKERKKRAINHTNCIGKEK